MTGIQDRVVARLRAEWPGMHIDRDGYPYTTPQVREGGATAALIDLAGKIAAEEAARPTPAVDPDDEFVAPYEMEPVSIADMAPGTTFWAEANGDRAEFWMKSQLRPGLTPTFRSHRSTKVVAEDIDPSTIRDVTPPAA